MDPENNISNSFVDFNSYMQARETYDDQKSGIGHKLVALSTILFINIKSAFLKGGSSNTSAKHISEKMIALSADDIKQMTIDEQLNLLKTTKKLIKTTTIKHIIKSELPAYLSLLEDLFDSPYMQQALGEFIDKRENF